MDDIQFDGQQSDERILSVLLPHVISKWISIGIWFFLSVVFFVVIMLLQNAIGNSVQLLIPVAILISSSIMIAGYWWNTIVFSKSKTYLTDRRIIRFEQVSPFFSAKRALFWNEVLKAKAFAPSFLFRLLRIGKVVVESHESGGENVYIDNVFLFDDVANYIDKILYIYKNKPDDISTIKPFIPREKGHRD